MNVFKLKRRRHRNRRRGSRRQIIVISVCLIVFVFILGTAYSAFSTDLSINSNGSIQEHTYTIEDLKSLVVTSGDGLYADSYESGRYVYKGVSPDNYILLGDDLFRIVAIESDGTLKVVSDESIGNMVFDPGYSTVISDGILDTAASSTEGTRYSSSESDYCYEEYVSSYQGCKVWGSSKTTLDNSENNVTTMPREIGGTEYNLPDTESYINMYLNQSYYSSLNSDVQSVIISHVFNVGPVAWANQTLEEDMVQEEAYKWVGHVGLLNVTDYVKANLNTSTCNSLYTNWSNTESDSNCRTTTWLYKEKHYYVISPCYDAYTYSVWTVVGSGGFNGQSAYGYTNIYPVMYLSSSIVLKNDGTYDSPYEIVY